MIDMLGICSDIEVSQSDLNRIKKELNLNSHGTLDRQYQYCHSFTLDGNHCFTLKWVPRIPQYKPTQMLINPSRFDSYKDMNKMVRTVLEGNLELNRVDFCSDLDIPLYKVEPITKIKYKQRTKEYQWGSTLTGMNYGSRSDVIIIYDKAFQLQKHSKKLINPKSKQECGHKTRFEVRKKWNKVPFRQYDDLERYTNYNPFRAIQLLDHIVPNNPRALSEAKAMWAHGQCREIGFHRFYKLWNDKNNFNKTMMKFFAYSDLNKTLLNNYQKKFSTFMGVQYVQ